MQGPNPNYIQAIIAALMQPKDQSQFAGEGGSSDMAKNILPMAQPTPVPTTSIPAPQQGWGATVTPQNPQTGQQPAQVGSVPMNPQTWSQVGNPTSYYNLLAGGFGFDPYRTPG
jgi:hypothetical protein